MLANRRLNPHAASLTLLFLLAGTTWAADKVEWRSDYDNARREATEQGKFILLDFGTDDCVHCRRMHQTTFRDPAITKIINERFVALKIDANREPRLAQSLRVQAYPTLVLAGNDGKILAWIEGYMEVNRLVEHLNRASTLATPDWMVRDYQEATRAMSQSDYARAVTYLKKIGEDGKNRPVQAKARESLQEIETQAASRLARAKMLDEKGQILEALDLLTDLTRTYAGSQSAAEGGKLLTTLAAKPEVQARQRGRRAQELLASARDDFKAGRILECLEQCETLAAAYRDLPEGKEGERSAGEIKANPEHMTKVCEAMNDRLAASYLTLADSWTKKGNPEQAAIWLEKVLKLNPTGPSAVLAQTRLAQIQNRPIGNPTLEQP
jgi:thioredoxin-like negative regulator of GroEL